MAGGTVAGRATRRLRLSPQAAAVVTHPVVVVALAVLVLNDHVAKARWPGAATGIASDVAGLVVLPVAILVLFDALGRRPVGERTPRTVAAIVALGFAAVELLPSADAGYEIGLGVAGWPVRSLFGGVEGRVVATPDPLDLLALPAAAVGALLWTWAASPSCPRTVRADAAESDGRAGDALRARLGVLITIALAPALLATSAPVDSIAATANAPFRVELDAAHPSATVIVSIDADLPPSSGRIASMDIDLAHRPGEPALLISATGTTDGAHAAYVGETSSEAGLGAHLAPCRASCRFDIPLTVELADPTSGSWSAQPAVDVEMHGGADGELAVSVAADPDASTAPTGRLLATADVKALQGAGGTGADALLLRTRHPSAATGSWDGNGDFQPDQLMVVADLPEDERGLLHVVHGRFGFRTSLDADIDGRQCEQAVPSCEQLAVIVPPEEPTGGVPGRATTDPIGVVVVDGRPPGADPVEVDLVPAALTTTTVPAGDARSQAGVPVAISPGQTLYALIDLGDRTGRWEDELVIDATTSDGANVRTDFRPGVTQIEACPAAAPAPCTSTIRWSMKTPGPIELQTLLAPSA